MSSQGSKGLLYNSGSNNKKSNSIVFNTRNVVHLVEEDAVCNEYTNF